MIYLLFGLFVALQLLDAYTTYLAISRKVGKEANKVMALVFDKIGLVPGLAAMKVPVIAGLWFSIPYPYSQYPFIALILFYAFVVFNNYKVLKNAANSNPQ